MKTRVPPPILALLMIGLVYLSSLLIGSVSFDYQASVSVLLVIVGLSCALPSYRLFARNKTTISPLTPSETSVLITQGMYRYSRNPMYLGLLLLIIAATIWFGTWFGIIISVFFILLINILQIIPEEEEALLQIFGEEYLEYKKKVRRWI
tara:strand:+ start:100 stop:549 length:450 start_codon:yes stop_codon:yes gene_type:complete